MVITLTVWKELKFTKALSLISFSRKRSMSCANFSSCLDRFGFSAFSPFSPFPAFSVSLDSSSAFRSSLREH